MDGTVKLLQSLAAAGLQHGDLKATNIVLAQGQAVLIDYDAVRTGSPDKDRARFMLNWADDTQLHEQWSQALHDQAVSS